MTRRKTPRRPRAGPPAGLPPAATFDPVDAPLYQAFAYYQSLPNDVRAKQYQCWYWADPKNWTTHRPADWVFKLQWHEYRYATVQDRAALRAIITRNTPGIYVFTVRPPTLLDAKFPHYVFYVGISNAGNSKRPVRDRLGDYLPSAIPKIRKRKSVHKFLRLFYDSAWVRFAYVTKPSRTLEKAEEKLHGYLAPPVPDRDFPVDMKTSKPAFSP